jgi:glycosyltransferase 2 family protein
MAIALSVLPLVALINVGVLVWSVDGVDLAGRVAAPGLLVLAAIFAFFPMFANSLRLYLWSRFLGLGLHFTGSLRVITGAMVTNSITPSAAGSVPIKLLFLIAEGVAARRAATVLSLQTAEDAVVLFSLLALCVGMSGFQLADFLAANPGLLARIEANLVLAGWIAVGVVAVLGLLGMALVFGLLGAALRERAFGLGAMVRRFAAHILGDWVGVIRRGKIFGLANLVIGLAQWLVRFSMAGLVLAAFGDPWHPALYWLLQYLVQSISSVVPTPGGAGGAEAAFLLLFAPFVSAGVLILAMSAWRLLFFYLPLAGAAMLFFLLHRIARRDRLQADEPDAEADPEGVLAHPAQ